jgi:hypothetical protein
MSDGIPPVRFPFHRVRADLLVLFQVQRVGTLVE